MFACCAPEPEPVWFAPGEDDFRDDLIDNQTDGDETRTETTDYRALDRGVDSEVCPTWMEDKESDVCLQCGKLFSTTNRRTHCRRCRNLFCKRCTSQQYPILLYGIREDAKVCEACFNDLPAENTYIKLHQPLLLRGESFNKATMMGMSSRVVELRLYGDMKTLVYDDVTNKSKPTEISLAQVRKIALPGLTSFELKTHEKSYEFEADTANTQKKWVDALKAAVERAHRPSLKDFIHRERREAIENRYKEEDAINRARLAESTKANRASKREAIRSKYSGKK